jgi:hypothetical protein
MAHSAMNTHIYSPTGDQTSTHPLEEPEWQPYVFEGVHQPLVPPPFLLGSGGTSPATMESGLCILTPSLLLSLDSARS